MVDRATTDFETRSACPLKTSGTWKYSLDPSTEVLCLAYRLPWWEEGRTALWHPAFFHLGIEEGEDFNDLEELFLWIESGGLVEGHGVFFELAIWQNIMVARHGWPAVKVEQWRCSAAKAASHALPRGLEDANDAMLLNVAKDIGGSKVMKKLAKPRKPVKKELVEWNRQHAPCGVCGAKGKIKIGRAKATPCEQCNGQGWLGIVPDFPSPIYYESKEQFYTLFNYCRYDVLAEEALSQRIPDLNPHETEVFLMDLAVNARGFQLDRDAVETALHLIDLESANLNAELAEITEGAVERATQRTKLIEWMDAQGVQLGNTRKDTIADLLERITEEENSEEDIPFGNVDASPSVKRALEILKALGKSSTAKYETMQDWLCPDDRVHGGILYHGAATGRWAGKGVQPHNFPRGSIADQEALWTLLKTRDRERIIAEAPQKKGVPQYDSVMAALSEGLRGVIIPTPGHQLYVADYAAIEARVLLWLADDQEAMEVFRRGEDCECQKRGCNRCDIYLNMSVAIYDRQPLFKDTHKDERATGKIAVLGLGYQMGAAKFQITAEAGGSTLSDDFAKQIVDAYRTKFWRVKEMWREMEECAMQAVLSPGTPIWTHKVKWIQDDPEFLYCELPSGRRLAYPFPDVREAMMPWGDVRDVLTFKSINPFNRQWQRDKTYGGMLVENVVQAVARDLMADAMLRCAESGIYTPILSVHDEMIAEAPLGVGNVHEFEQLMATNPDWAQGCPVGAEGWAGTRYRK